MCSVVVRLFGCAFFQMQLRLMPNPAQPPLDYTDYLDSLPPIANPAPHTHHQAHT